MSNESLGKFETAPLPAEQAPTPETEVDLSLEQQTTVAKPFEQPKTRVSALPSVQPAESQSKPVSLAEPTDRAVGSLLEENLADVYSQMTVTQQQAFKKKGEETASKISQLLKETKIKVQKIFQLIVDWLKMIPGVNKFFLEQEAKIKTEKILALKEDNQEDK